MVQDEKVLLSDIIGESGKHQKLTFLVSFYASWFLGTAIVAMDVLAPTVSIYWDWDDPTLNRTTFDSNNCKMQDIMDLNRTSLLSNSSSRLIFKTPYSRNTLTEQLNLICERSWFVSLANFLSLFGYAVGSLLIRLSENYGRRPFIIQASIFSLVLGICMIFPAGYVMLAITFCLLRASISQACNLLFIQAVEVTTPAGRSYIGVLMTSGALFGQMVLVGAAWILKDWFYIQLFQTLLIATMVPVVCYIPESPLWLAVRGRYEDSKKVLIKIAHRNGTYTQESESKIDIWLQQMKVRCEIETNAEKGNIKDLFKNRRIAFYTCGIAFTQFAFHLIYNSLVMTAETFGSGLFIDLISSSAFSFIAVLIVASIVKKVSIRIILSISFLLECFTCAMYPITYDFPLARTVISVFARFFLSAQYTIARQYMNEVFPTSVRAVGSGFTIFVASILSSPAPFTKELANITSIYVPFILFAMLSIISAIIFKLMPETMGRPIVHTVHDLKQFKDSKGRRKAWRSKVYTISSGN